jgi:hypothetical protein
MAGKEARLVCTALCDAHGAPGSGVYIPPHGRAEDAALPTAEADAAIRRWGQPAAVRKLHADSYLKPSTCLAVARTFPNLQELTLHAGASSYATLAAGLTALTALRTPWAAAVVRTAACAHAFSALQSLALQFGPGFNGVIPTLAMLTELTSLALTSAPGAIACRKDEFNISVPAGDVDGNDDERELEVNQGDDPSAAPMEAALAVAAAAVAAGTDDAEAQIAIEARALAIVAIQELEVWGMLAALPKLARLELGLVPNYHTDLPDEELELPCVTHLSLACHPTMVQRDEHTGVEVPLVQVSPHSAPALLFAALCCAIYLCM